MVAGGRVGGLFDAEILPGGADWQVVRPDGTVEIDTRYSARTAAGEYVHFRTSGVRSGPPAVLAASVLRALRELNPNQPAAEFRPIQTIVDRAVSPRRFFILLVAGFAGLGLLLAALGGYGGSYLVTEYR